MRRTNKTPLYLNQTSDVIALITTAVLIALATVAIAGMYQIIAVGYGAACIVFVITMLILHKCNANCQKGKCLLATSIILVGCYMMAAVVTLINGIVLISESWLALSIYAMACIIATVIVCRRAFSFASALSST